jgi:hypothetical protein
MGDFPPPPLGMFDWLKLMRAVRMPPAVKNVAAWLASFGDADGTNVFPGLDKLTMATGLSRDTAVQALAALRESGLLVRTKRGGGRGSHLSDEYQIGVPDCHGSPEQLGKVVTAAYESARPTRKGKPRDPNESASPTSKAANESDQPTPKATYESDLRTYESDLQTYESDLRTYESDQPTPPTRDLPEDQPEYQPENPPTPQVGADDGQRPQEAGTQARQARLEAERQQQADTAERKRQLDARLARYLPESPGAPQVGADDGQRPQEAGTSDAAGPPEAPARQPDEHEAAEAERRAVRLRSAQRIDEIQGAARHGDKLCVKVGRLGLRDCERPHGGHSSQLCLEHLAEDRAEDRAAAGEAAETQQAGAA